jgi:hypothetical protein
MLGNGQRFSVRSDGHFVPLALKSNGWPQAGTLCPTRLPLRHELVQRGLIAGACGEGGWDFAVNKNDFAGHKDGALQGRIALGLPAGWRRANLEVLARSSRGFKRYSTDSGRDSGKINFQLLGTYG